MPNNTGLDDLHLTLMEQLDRLMDCETDEELERETKRAKAVGDIAKNIVENTKNVIEANKVALEYGFKPVNSQILISDAEK